MTYGIPPGYSIVSDAYIEMPCDQALWDAATAERWGALAATGKKKSSPLSLRDAVSRVMYGNNSTSAVPTQLAVPAECWTWSPYAVNVVLHAVAIQLWHITQGSFFFGEPSGPAATVAAAEAALSRCRALITSARSDADYACWTTEAEGPLLFNCLAVLRVSHCRAFTGIGGADSMMLLKQTRPELTAAIAEFVAVAQDRGDRVTRAVARAIEGMLIPYRIGTSLLKKTAALTWAVEHALAGWDAGK